MLSEPTPESLFAASFIAAWTLALALRMWLSLRQARSIRAHRDHVPEQFAAFISAAAHDKAAAYGLDKLRLGRAETLANALFLLVLTFGGVLAWLSGTLGDWLPDGGIAHGTALILAVVLLSSLVDLPFAYFRQFVVEARHGFNRMQPALFFADALKGTALLLAVGAPLIALALLFMREAGSAWWLWVWALWAAFNMLAVWLYPTLIAPLFNRFVPLADAALAERVNALLARCGFRSGGLFVMDGSRRSAHGNAYFTGFGRKRRIVFFDTLLAKLTPPEVEAVLAHELGHFHHRHVTQRIVIGLFSAAIALWLLAQLRDSAWFFTGLAAGEPGDALALVLFALVLPVFLFPASPLFSALSRRHEFEADRYAVRHTSAAALSSALIGLYKDNAATLTPDPLHSLFYDSHPPASIRLAHIGQPA